MSANIRVRIARIIPVVVLTAIATATIVAPALAKPVFHPGKAHRLASGAGSGWVFPLIVVALIVATVVVVFSASQLRAVAGDRRRRSQPLRTSAVASTSPGDTGSDAEAA